VDSADTYQHRYVIRYVCEGRGGPGVGEIDMSLNCPINGDADEAAVARIIEQHKDIDGVRVVAYRQVDA